MNDNLPQRRCPHFRDHDASFARFDESFGTLNLFIVWPGDTEVMTRLAVLLCADCAKRARVLLLQLESGVEP